jgi:hypothetical protein
MDLDLYAMAYPDTFIINGNEYNGKRDLGVPKYAFPTPTAAALLK